MSYVYGRDNTVYDVGAYNVLYRNEKWLKQRVKVEAIENILKRVLDIADNERYALMRIEEKILTPKKIKELEPNLDRAFEI